MNRREFLKKAGVGSLAVASFPALAEALAGIDKASAHGLRRTEFFFVTVSFAAPPDAIILNGAGWFSSHFVHGEGSFTHFRTEGSPPLLIVGTGTWRAHRLLSFTPTSPPSFGSHVGGVLEMLVKLFPAGGPPISGVTMKVVCNIPPGGMSTGQDEGVTLTVPGAPFGAFVPSVPPIGATAFTRRVEVDD